MASIINNTQVTPEFARCQSREQTQYNLNQNPSPAVKPQGNGGSRPEGYYHYYKIKHSCAVICWIGPQGQCGGTGRAAGGTGIKKSENNAYIVCWNKGNKRAWLELSDCLFESSWQVCWACWGNCLKFCLISPNQY